MVERTVAEFGSLDAAFNNAGVMAKIAPTARCGIGLARWRMPDFHWSGFPMTNQPRFLQVCLNN